MIHPTAVIGEPPEARAHRHAGLGIPPLIAPTATVEAFVTVDAGVERPTCVGAGTWLMKKVHVGHDAQIGVDCEIAPLASIGGYVEIGNRVKVGQGAVFKPRVRVGDDAVIGAGAVVTKDVPAGEVWVGNPARRLEKRAPTEQPTPLEEAGWELFAAARPDGYDEWAAWWDESRGASGPVRNQR